MKSAAPVEEKCQACDGAGHQAVKQPSQPNRRIYPPLFVYLVAAADQTNEGFPDRSIASIHNKIEGTFGP